MVSCSLFHGFVIDTEYIKHGMLLRIIAATTAAAIIICGAVWLAPAFVAPSAATLQDCRFPSLDNMDKDGYHVGTGEGEVDHASFWQRLSRKHDIRPPSTFIKDGGARWVIQSMAQASFWPRMCVVRQHVHETWPLGCIAVVLLAATCAPCLLCGKRRGTPQLLLPLSSTLVDVKETSTAVAVRLLACVGDQQHDTIERDIKTIDSTLATHWKGSYASHRHENIFTLGEKISVSPFLFRYTALVFFVAHGQDERVLAELSARMCILAKPCTHSTLLAATPGRSTRTWRCATLRKSSRALSTLP